MSAAALRRRPKHPPRSPPRPRTLRRCCAAAPGVRHARCRQSYDQATCIGKGPRFACTRRRAKGDHLSARFAPGPLPHGRCARCAPRPRARAPACCALGAPQRPREAVVLPHKGATAPMPFVAAPRRPHSVGGGASALSFDLLFQCGSVESDAAPLCALASVGAGAAPRPPLQPSPAHRLKSPGLRRRDAAAADLAPDAAAAIARTLSAPRGALERAIAAVATAHAADAAAAPGGDGPHSPGSEARAASKLAQRLRGASYDAHAVGDSASLAGERTASSASPAAGVHRNPMHRAARHPAWVVVDPTGAHRGAAPRRGAPSGVSVAQISLGRFEGPCSTLGF